MDSSPSPKITSFVLRFVYDLAGQLDSQPDTSRPVYRCMVRHIQSGREMVFTDWSSATAFIENYVPLILEG